MQALGFRNSINPKEVHFKVEVSKKLKKNIDLNGKILELSSIMQPTYSPSKVKKIRMCGFFARKATKGGRGVLAARRRKGRRKLCA